MSDSLSVTGTADLEIPQGLFITAVEVSDNPSPSNVYSHTESFLPYSTTVDSTIRRTSGTGTITYEVTVFNNTPLTYSYRDIYYQTNLTGYNGNNYVTKTPNRYRLSVECSLENASAEEKIVLPGETKTFTVTYTVGRSMSSSTNWRTLINFQFGINVSGEREALEIVEDKFLNILNTNSTYLQLLDALDNKYDGSQEWTSNYIGNVKGSSSADSVAVNTLFAGQLQITVGKDQMDATVLIKHENLDWNNRTGDDYVALPPNSNGTPFYGYGCEMTLYLTVDPLEKAGSYVPVYAVVFTCDRDENGNRISDWYRIGSTYAGTANVVTYDGGNGTGSFVTDNWRADADTYSLVAGYDYSIKGEVYRLDEYTHSVAQGTSIEDIVTAKDPQAVATLQTLLNDAKRIIDNHAYAGVGIDLIRETRDSLSEFYTMDENGNHTVNPDLTIAQLSPSIEKLYKVVNDALIQIEALNSQEG
ncbi:MAG: hypothetical protein IJD38_00080 [Clostridia bacterium]|nr:hypothetical protein [Clostridia bacterium]